MPMPLNVIKFIAAKKRLVQRQPEIVSDLPNRIESYLIMIFVISRIIRVGQYF